MVKAKFTPEKKIQIVLEAIKTSIGTAELCRKHNLNPQTFYDWKEKFMEGGKSALKAGKGSPAKAAQKKEEDYKRIIGELTIANDALKKTLEASKN